MSMSMSELLPRLRSARRQEMDDFVLQLYRDFPIKHQSAFGSFMKEAEAGRTLLYHCSTGKEGPGLPLSCCCLHLTWIQTRFWQTSWSRTTGTGDSSKGCWGA